MNEVLYKNEYMSRLVRHIEDNLPFELDAGLLSRIGYVSLPKLYRDFYNLTGHSVKEYIRKRRLSNALALIKTSDMELTDIAFQCGYSSHQALCRAVRQTLDLTPSEYKIGDIYYFFPPFNGKPLQSVTVSNDIIPQAIRILYYNSKLTNIENVAVKTFLQVFPNYNERIFGRNGKQDGNKFCYELYLTDIETDYSKLKPYGFEVTQKILFLAATFATLTVRNDEPKINTAWDYLYSEWLQYSMFEYTDEPYYEEYIIKNAKPIKLKLFLPIRKRSEETKITLISNSELCFITAKAKGYNAEKIASQTVVDYITKNYPHIINSTRDLFCRKEINSYVCGIRVNSDFQFIEDENVTKTTTEDNNYLVLESGVMGDYDRYAEMLFSFARDNGMEADRKGVFAIYNTKKGIDNLSVKMYCPVKIVIK
ncbi:MAG: AraC family transcriptional regulator [Clostridiales bacterium]|jgi:AraC-like DNA-binding protein/predicted transcriptional regulator YdeE|nr:AraC family transcriptional regulator [Clostridiales bacterium]